MSRFQAEAYCTAKGHAGLELHKESGVWYLVGDRDGSAYRHDVERCLHVTKLADVSPELIDAKIEELTQ